MPLAAVRFWAKIRRGHHGPWRETRAGPRGLQCRIFRNDVDCIETKRIFSLFQRLIKYAGSLLPDLALISEQVGLIFQTQENAI